MKRPLGLELTRNGCLSQLSALPLLTRASRVMIFEFCTSDRQDTARSATRDISGYLESHGASCQCEVRVHSAESDARSLIRLAKEENADLIVTGGYGHSRLGEWMFGDMTRGLLQEAPICLMMSH